MNTKKLRIFCILLILLIFLYGCIKLEVNDKTKQSDNKKFEKCIETFKEGKLVNNSKELPPYLIDELAKEFCRQVEDQSQKQLENMSNTIYGVYLDQGIIIGKEGDEFNLRVKNNAGGGDFYIKIDKTNTASGNNIEFEPKELSFHMESNEEKIIKIYAKPNITSSYKLKKDYFPINIIAKKNDESFRGASVIITVATY